MKNIRTYQSSINIPKNLSIEKKNNFLIFCGPLGFSKINLTKLDKKGCAALSLDIDKRTIRITSPIQSFFNSLENLIKNKINGICRGFLVYLRIVGIGFRTTLKDDTLILKLGYSHDVKYKIPNPVRVFLIEPTLICLFGLDKNQVTQIAAKIRQIRPPSPYKGKGIRWIDEKIFIKQGKQK